MNLALPMAPLQIVWEWPHTALVILITIAGAIAADIVVRWIMRRALSQAEKRAQEGRLGEHRWPSLAIRGHVEDEARRKAIREARQRALPRTAAVAHLLMSLWHFAITLIVVLMILETLGIPIAPILTSAGIGGVILAFGAQSLIKDYFSGIFLILEDQYGVGDQITVGTITGTVEDVTLRITKLRDTSGMVWYVRNGEILQVGNISQGFSTGLIDVPVAYDADVVTVTRVLEGVVAKLEHDPDIAEQLLEPAKLLGVESITATTLTMRILIKTPPNQHFALAREIRERAIEALNDAGVPGPKLMSTTGVFKAMTGLTGEK
ncbi:MAG: mechanosensitive ion channel family protein [Propionibacteriaceae bacterium]|jgi:small conductance mechanosensitive channel|nr:mechanosensitive ion channel family protein [Propionibacteriaceae bacterium]